MRGIIPTGETQVFPVVGDPIAQVRSPAKVTEILIERQENALVVPMHIPPTGLSGLMDACHGVRNIGGLLVTIPHKRNAFDICVTKTERARFVEAVNVVRKTEDGWLGDNTDGLGYLDGLAREGFDVRSKKVLLVGCGGAGSAIALEILQRGAAHLAIHDIDDAQRDKIIARLNDKFPGRVGVGSRDVAGYDLIANATPLGMKPDDALPVDVSKIEAWQFVACVITKPDVPPLIAEARKRGCRTMTGAGMFDAQAETLADFLLGNAIPGEDNL